MDQDIIDQKAGDSSKQALISLRFFSVVEAHLKFFVGEDHRAHTMMIVAGDEGVFDPAVASFYRQAKQVFRQGVQYGEVKGFRACIHPEIIAVAEIWEYKINIKAALPHDI